MEAPKSATTDIFANTEFGFGRDAEFEHDNDSLYVLPLKIVPFTTPGLRFGKLVKNAILEPAIEIFQYAEGFSAQILIEDVTPELGHNLFGWKSGAPCSDMKILLKLALLTSYDVFSLRILFRNLNIPIASIDYLNLSDYMKEELDSYMQVFTQPLVKQIYGELAGENLGSANIINLFSNPDSERALQNLRKLAQIMGVSVQTIPTFLEDFADLYLSFSYYQKCLDDIAPKMVDMATEINDLKDNYHMKHNHYLTNSCRELVANLSDLTASTNGRFEKFHSATDKMWEDISAEKFRNTETLIKSYHTTIGGVLCGLGIKMNAWKKRFPTRKSGSPQARVETLLSSMLPGMEKIMEIDRGIVDGIAVA